MKYIPVYIFLAAVVLLGIAGCGPKQVLPYTEYLPDSRLPDIAIKHPIAVIAVRNHDAEATISCKTAIKEYFVRLDDLNTTAVDSLYDILRRKNINVDTNADRKLYISIVDIFCPKIEVSRVKAIDFRVTLRVRTGSNISRDFIGHNTAGSVRTHQNFAKAINSALLEIFRDNVIMDYLKN
jgi:hypothetical protein